MTQYNTAAYQAVQQTLQQATTHLSLLLPLPPTTLTPSSSPFTPSPSLTLSWSTKLKPLLIQLNFTLPPTSSSSSSSSSDISTHPFLQRNDLPLVLSTFQQTWDQMDHTENGFEQSREFLEYVKVLDRVLEYKVQREEDKSAATAATALEKSSAAVHKLFIAPRSTSPESKRRSSESTSSPPPSTFDGPPPTKKARLVPSLSPVPPGANGSQAPVNNESDIRRLFAAPRVSQPVAAPPSSSPAATATTTATKVQWSAPPPPPPPLIPTTTSTPVFVPTPIIALPKPKPERRSYSATATTTARRSRFEIEELSEEEEEEDGGLFEVEEHQSTSDSDFEPSRPLPRSRSRPSTTTTTTLPKPSSSSVSSSSSIPLITRPLSPPPLPTSHQKWISLDQFNQSTIKCTKCEANNVEECKIDRQVRGGKPTCRFCRVRKAKCSLNEVYRILPKGATAPPASASSSVPLVHPSVKLPSSQPTRRKSSPIPSTAKELMEELELARKKVIRLEDALRKLTEEGGGEKEVVGDVALGSASPAKEEVDEEEEDQLEADGGDEMEVGV